MLRGLDDTLPYIVQRLCLGCACNTIIVSYLTTGYGAVRFEKNLVYVG